MRFEALLNTYPEDDAEAPGHAGIVPWALGVLHDDPDHFARRRAIVALAKDDATVARCARTLIDSEVRLTTIFVATSRGRETETKEDAQTARLLIAMFDGIAAQAALGIGTDEAAVTEAVNRLISMTCGAKETE